ncbi:MAG TPA: hypothetical protein VL401_03185 [Alphaproteobacteria bacterium]|jgi:hypothetical protein|nr:hypothetical protein [Alphaproteobacteria bacterium]
MSEQGEGQPIPFEGWVQSEDIKEVVDQHLLNIGNGALEAFPQSLMLENTSSKRTDQVVLALKYASGLEMFQQKMGTSVGQLSVNVGDTGISLNFLHARSEEPNKSLRILNNIVTKTNEILETFDQAKIPSFTLKPTRTITTT